MDVDRLPPEERRQALIAYADGTLSPEEARRVAAWLATHPEAAAEVEAHRRVADLLPAYGDEPVPPGFAERVIARAKAEAREAVGRLVRLPRWVPLAAAAVLLLALGGAGLLLARRERSDPVREGAFALDAVPADLLEHADVLLGLSEEEFDAVLTVDPDELAAPVQGG
jgi:anti-sigma factor RsiW